MKKPGIFDVLKEMAVRDMEIARGSDVTDFTRQSKKNGGKITIGIASPAFDWAINSAAGPSPTHMSMMFVFNLAQYEQIEKELTEAPDMNITFK